ncbi:MAG: FAD-dependent oxidoreductase, partial [Pyrinomonadaceae bacterium]
PRVLAPTLQMRARPRVLFAGQISGVEGYVESVATGWLAGVNAARVARGEALLEAPRKSALGALARYVSGAESKNYQPVNITFALLEPLPEVERRRFRKKRDRHARQVELALGEWDAWLQTIQGGEGAQPLAAAL